MNRLQEAINRVRSLWRIASVYDSDILHLDRAVERLRGRLNEMTDTTIHTDIHYEGKDMIIVVGHYKNRDYVRMFYVDPQSFVELVALLKQIEPCALRGRFDMPHGPPFSAVYECDRF